MSETPTIHATIQAWSEATPNAPAIRGVARSPLSFQRLDRQVRTTVQVLHRAGIGCGDRVAIVLPSGPDLAVCCYTVACAATSAPLNPAYTIAEFAAFFSRMRPRALITSFGPESAAVLAARSACVPVILLVAEQEAGAFHLNAPAEDQPIEGGMAKADEVALLLHTSGSTARPKMVPLTHTNLCASAVSTGRALALTPQDCCLIIMPLFHINALVTSGLSTLASGGCLACPPEFDGPSFFDWMEEFQPTWFSAVPAMQQAMIAHVHQTQYQPCNSRLRFVRSSASSLTPQLRELTETLLGVPVIDGYGLTEANCTTLNPLPPGIRKPGSVGRTVCGETAIMGSGEVLLPPGESGEIVIRGLQVMHAYADDPAANQASFAGDWFRTGDQGKFDQDGYLFLTGRIKEMINRGGEKIGPREVDEALLAHPAVAEAVAFAIPEPSLGEDVAAAVVLRAGAHVTSAELREFAGQRLAAFKVPRMILFLPELPKGPTGKVNRIALAADLSLLSPSSGEFSGDAPASLTEWLLTEMWEDVLKCRPIGRHDDFIALGGHSLLAARILSRVGKCFGKSFSLSSLLEAPTVARMAALIGEDARPVASCVIPIQRGSAGAVRIFLLNGSPIFAPLIEALPRELPLFTVSTFDANSLPQTYTLADLARRQIQAIQEFQRAGPYVLAGWCADGRLAYEMAQQLRAEGHEVPLLVLMETFNRAPLRHNSLRARWQIKLWDRWNREQFHWNNQAGRGPKKVLRYLGHRWNSVVGRAKRKASSLGISLGWLHETPDAHACLAHAIRRDTPLPYQGAVLHFRAEHRRQGVAGDPAAGWLGLIEDVEVCDIPGGHSKIFVEPNVQAMARKLASRMEAFTRCEQASYEARTAVLGK